MWPSTCLPRSTATHSPTFLMQALSDFITPYDQANQTIGPARSQSIVRHTDEYSQHNEPFQKFIAVIVVYS